MDSNNQILGKIKIIKLPQKVFVFSFFLIISTILWFFNALNKDYSTVLNFPVAFVNMPENKVNTNELPAKLAITINADGFNILSHKFSSNFIPIKIDFNTLKINQLTPKDSSNLYFLTNNNISQNIESQFNKNFKLLKIRPDSIFFNFTYITEKKVAVKLTSEINYKHQFMPIKKSIFSPDSITIKGAATILDSINYIETEKLKLNKLSKNYYRQLPLVLRENIFYSQNSVDIEIEVEEYTEYKITIPIEIINLPKNEKIKIFPNKIKITYLVGFSRYDKISDQNFTAIIDYNLLKFSPSNKLKPQITINSDYIKSFTSEPSYVDFIIE